MRTLPLLLALLLPTAALAAPALHVNIDRRDIAFGDTVSLQVQVVSDSQQPSQADLRAPTLNGWRLVGRFERSSYDSRRRSSVTVLSLTLQAVATGELEIGAFVLRAGGQEIKSDPIKVKVSGDGPAVGPAPPPPEAPPEDTVFLRWEVSPDKAWLGQQLLARLYVYVDDGTRVSEFDVGDIGLEGFWTHDLTQRGRGRGQRVRVGDRAFQREQIAGYLLFPIRSGQLQLPAVKARATVVERDAIGRAIQRSFEARAEAVPLPVEALPEQDKPKGFASPAVGRVELTANVDRRRVRADEGIQLTVTTQVEGLLQNVPEVDLPGSVDFRVFPPTTDVKSGPRGETMGGTRRQTWLLRPKRGGMLTVPALELPYFDPIQGRYVVARTAPINVEVVGEPKAEAEPAAARGSAGAGEALAALRSVRKDVDLATRDRPLHATPWYLLFVFGPPLCFVGLVARDRYATHRDATAGSRAARRAGAMAQAELQRVRKLDAAEAYAALARALLTYLETRFGEPLRGLTHPALARRLGELGVDEAAVHDLVKELENADFARFAPGGGAGALGEACERARLLVERVERCVA